MTNQTFTFGNASGWTNSALALENPAAGFAQFSLNGNGAVSSTLVLTTPGPVPSGTFFVDGIQVNVTHQQGSPAPSLFATMQISNGAGLSSNLADGKSFGPGPFPNLNPAQTTFGSASNQWGFNTISLAKFLDDFSLNIQAVNPSVTGVQVNVWYVDMVLSLQPALTAQEVIERAYRKLAILSKDTTIQPEDLAHGLDLLNDMLFGWEMFGVDINHVELEASDPVPLARKFTEGTVMQLAARISQDYQVPPVASDRFFAALSRAYNLDNEPDYRDDDGDGVVSEAEVDQDKVSRFF